jgi:hypothetical protein
LVKHRHLAVSKADEEELANDFEAFEGALLV